MTVVNKIKKKNPDVSICLDDISISSYLTLTTFVLFDNNDLIIINLRITHAKH